MLEDLPVETILLILYHYIPSKSAAIAALVLYILVTIAVTAVTLKTRAFFMLTVSITGILEVLGKQALVQAVQRQWQHCASGRLLAICQHVCNQSMMWRVSNNA